MSPLLARLLQLFAVLPLLGFWIGRPGAAWLPTLLFALPLLAVWRARWRQDEAHLVDEVAWLAALCAAVVTPLWPAMLRVDGFDAPLFPALGAVFWLAGRGRLTRLTAAPRGGRVVRLLLVVWAAWSIGGALRGFWLHTPAGVPWLLDELFALATFRFGEVSMVASVAPFNALFLRLVTILFLWCGFELALGALGRGEGPRFEARLVRVFAWSLVLGLGVSVVEFVEEGMWRGDASPLARLSQGIARNPRPLLDHNALGSLLTLVVPLLLFGAVSLKRRGWRARGLLAGAAAVGLFLLVTSRSKSALAGTACALGVAALLVAWTRGGRWRQAAAALLVSGAVAIVGINLAPDSLVERAQATRYGHDLVRVVRFDAARDYLNENRTAVWTQARDVAAEAPLTGVGLGRLPLRMGEHFATDAPGWFKPLHENAHSQYLQWRAEEGWVGLGLALLVLAGAVLGGLRRRSPVALAATGALSGLALNLVVGHGLLVSSVALAFAAVVGWLFAGGAMTREPDEAAEHAGRRPWLAPACAAATLLLALAPLATAERATNLAKVTFGAYPWEAWPGELPMRGRAMGPDARWFVKWGNGTVLKIPVGDFRDARFTEPITLDVFVNGEAALTGHALIHRTDGSGPVNEINYLRLERPADVQPGDWVRLRVVASDFFVGTRVFSHDNRRVAFKMSPGFYSGGR